MAETTEKFTINLGVVDLGKIDLLIEQGFYANRTDFVKDAIRRTLDAHNETVRNAVSRLESDTQGLVVEVGEKTRIVSSVVIGVMGLTPRALLDLRAKGQRMRLTCVGLIVLHDGVTPELAAETIESVKVYGSLRCSAEVREAIKDRIH